jgi:Fur family ferric uptake transcriptional regulator
MFSLEALIARLKEEKLRLTPRRLWVLELISTLTAPVSALELHGMLKKKRVKIDLVTVYRELARLSEIGMLQPVTLKDGIVRYELSPEGGHNHHLICTGCKNVTNVDMNHDDLHVLEKTISKKKKFHIISHSLEFYGTCQNCS